MNKPKDWWGNPENAQKWIDQVQKHSKDKSYSEQPDIICTEIYKGNFKTIHGEGKL